MIRVGIRDGSHQLIIIINIRPQNEQIMKKEERRDDEKRE
jgi:hypothetical protein